MITNAKTIGLLRKLQAVLPRPSLVTIYKAFIRPHLDYGDIMNYFIKNLNQYNTMLHEQ